MAGPDAIDARGWTLTLPKSDKTRLADFRIAVMTSAPSAPVAHAVRGQIEALAAFLRKQGAHVDDDARPTDPDEAHEAYVMLLRAATSARMDEGLHAKLLATRDGLAGRKDYNAWQTRANTMSHREWLRWDNLRHRMRYAWDAFFTRFDLLICPPAATTAYPHMQTGERWDQMIDVDGSPQPATTQMFWAGYSGMVLLPSTVAPIGIADDGLPVGVQIIAPQYRDHSAIRFAQLLEREYHAFTPPPGFA